MDHSKMSMRELNERGIRFTPELAGKIHKRILSEMSTERKTQMRKQFFELAEKLNASNNRKINGI